MIADNQHETCHYCVHNNGLTASVAKRIDRSSQYSNFEYIYYLLHTNGRY